MDNSKNHGMLDRVFWATGDFEGFEQLCGLFREAGSVCVMTDAEGGRSFPAPYIYTCSCCGVVIADENWNCAAFTEANVVSVRPVSNDYYVYTLEVETNCEVYPRLEDSDPDRYIVRLSFFTLPRGEKKSQDKRSDDESYKAFDIGLNRLFTGIYDLETLGWFCDSVTAVLDATSDEDDAMVMLTINERVQDPMAHAVYVNRMEYRDGALLLIADSGDGEELRLCLTPDRTAGVDRIACVNNSFYCAQIELARRPDELSPAYLQIGVFL